MSMVLVTDLGRWLGSALDATRFGRDRLERRVEQARRALEESYAQRMALERERAATAERERIYRELHDDVGAKLLSLVYAACNPRQAALAREALAAIRSIVAPERLDDVTLCDAVADWRGEIETRCEEAGCSLQWQERLSAAKLTGIQRFHLERVLRELVSNALEHSGGQWVRASIVCRGGRLALTVEDDGRGLEAAVKASSYGLEGIRRRVLDLDGTVRWEVGDRGGVRCRVVVPLPPFGG